MLYRAYLFVVVVVVSLLVMGLLFFGHLTLSRMHAYDITK